MTKVLILSDSHGLTEEVTAIKNRHKLEYMIHCGDSELEMDASELQGFFKVGGNTDMDTRFPNEQRVSIGNMTFFVVHGHLHQVKSGLAPLSYRAEEEGAQVVCYGHTHNAGAEKVGNQLCINPGSIRQPRNRPEKTYAIMEWDESNQVEVTFYTTDGQVVEDLYYQTNL